MNFFTIFIPQGKGKTSSTVRPTDEHPTPTTNRKTKAEKVNFFQIKKITDKNFNEQLSGHTKRNLGKVLGFNFIFFNVSSIAIF